MDDRLAYTITDFMRAVGLGRTRVYEEIRDGRLRARKVGGRTLIAAEDARAWLADQPLYSPQEKQDS